MPPFILIVVIAAVLGVELQSRIVAALRADPRVADVPVLPVASVPVRRGDVTRIELGGTVTSPEARAAAGRRTS